MARLINNRRVTGMTTNPTVAMNKRLVRDRRRRLTQDRIDRRTRALNAKPRIVEWTQGKVIVTQDLVTGKTTFRANKGDPHVTPRESFRVVLPRRE